MPDTAINHTEVQRRPLHQIISKLLLTTAYFWLPMIIFLGLADEVRGNKPPYGDVAILQWIHHGTSPMLDSLMVLVTALGSAPAVIVGVGLGTGILYITRRRREALFLLFCAAGTAAINVVLKLIFHRTRPELWKRIVTESSYSFPSGHAMISSAVALSAIVLCWRTRYRWIAVIFGVLYIVPVGLSRLYLGVHYPSDVLGGWTVSLLWVIIVRYAFDRYGRRRTVQ